MWKAFKNAETGLVHAVLMPKGMSPHGYAMDWPLVETEEPLTCPQCLQFAYERRSWDRQLCGLLPVEARQPRQLPIRQRR